MNTIYLDLNVKMYCIIVNVGFSSSCQIFGRFSTSLHCIDEKYTSMPEGQIFHILDDFLIVSQSAELGKQYLKTFISMCEGIGIPIARDKTIGLPFRGNIISHSTTRGSIAK